LDAKLLAKPRLRVRVWSRGTVERTFATVARQVEAKRKTTASEGVLSFLYQQMLGISEASSATSQMLRFALAVTALRLHAANGGLTPQQVGELARLAEATLKAAGVTPGRSKLGYLYADLETVQSEILQQSAHPFRAAWKQLSSVYQTRKSKPRYAGSALFESGHRALRLGHADTATAWLGAAESQPLAPEEIPRCRAARIAALFASGHVADALDLATATERALPDSDPAKAASTWRRTYLQAIATGELPSLLRLVRRGDPHYVAERVLQAYLANLCSSSQAAWEAMPRLATLARRPELKLRKEGALCRLTLTIERSYDAGVALPTRLQRLGEALERTDELREFEHELLVWAAATRFLARHKAFPLASLALSRYRALSLGASAGRSPDLLGTHADLMARPWFLALPGAG
jgi:hypothetical protein